MQVIPNQSTVAPATETITLDVGGMKCAGCVKAVETQLTQQPGVTAATVNLVTEVATVDCESGNVDPALLAEKLTAIGFPTQPRSLNKPLQPGELTPADRQQQETQQQVRRMAIALTLLLFSAIGHLVHFGWLHLPGLGNIWFHWGLATLALLFPGRLMIADGWRGLRHNAPNMNTLVGLGVLTAYTTSFIALLFPNLGWECFFDEPVMLVGFILLGRTLEQQARSRATKAFQALLALQPTIAHLIKQAQDSLPTADNGSIAIPASQVKVGEWLRVLPGEKIPVDGEILTGQTTLDESMLTGEATPVLKTTGDCVNAGSLNLSGVIVLQATRTGSDTTLSQIIALVETAQTRKAPIQGLADTVAGYFTYGVMAIASLTFLFWYFIGLPLWSDRIYGLEQMAGQMVGQMAGQMQMGHMMPAALPPSPLLLSLKLAIAVLVIACPCALGLATPTAILVGSGIGAERGLLIRGGDVLEKVHRLQTVVFDKTGTLTIGHPDVTDCIALSKISELELLQVAASVESGTQHPLANAIRQAAQRQEIQLRSATLFHTQPGLGVSAQVEGQSVVLGNLDWLTQHGIDMEAATQAQALEAAGKTLVYVGIAGQLVGWIAAQDTLRPDALATVATLRQMGLRVMLLTGDRQTAAEAIAQPLGLAAADILANVRPADKSQVIQELQAAGQSVAMIGDGINDAPALAQADVGISLHSGTDVAIEAADIVLMRDRLSAVVEAIRLSQATFNKIRQNLFWAFAYNVLGIPAAAGLLLPTWGVALSPAAAGALMAFSSVSVVTNSLLLRRTFADR
jgi:P-type Cu2+ transporter